MASKKELYALLQRIESGFNGRFKADEGTLKEWARLLAPVPIERLNTTYDAYLAGDNGKHPPQLSDFLKAKGKSVFYSKASPEYEKSLIRFYEARNCVKAYSSGENKEIIFIGFYPKSQCVYSELLDKWFLRVDYIQHFLGFEITNNIFDEFCRDNCPGDKYPYYAILKDPKLNKKYKSELLPQLIDLAVAKEKDTMSNTGFF